MVQDLNLCFACGKENPYGLKLDFYQEDGWTCADFIPDKYYQGYPNILHGGITTTLMDEAMAKALLKDNIIALSVKLEIHLKKKIEIGEKVRVKAKLLEKRRKIYILEALVEGVDKKEIKALAKGYFHQVSL